MKGTLTGIGVGPGDPELLTLKAVKAIKHTKVLFYPVTRSGAESAALEIVEDWVNPETRLIPLLSRMTSDPKERQAQRFQQSRQIAQVLDSGMDAVMITIGDALLYSTYSYVMKELKAAGYSLQTIPGITAASAAAAKLDIPLAEEDEKLVIWPGTDNKDHLLHELETMTDNMALLKVSACRQVLYQYLQQQETTIDFALASQLGSQNETVHYDIECLKNPELPYMSVALLKRKESKNE